MPGPGSVGGPGWSLNTGPFQAGLGSSRVVAALQVKLAHWAHWADDSYWRALLTFI